MDLAFTQLLRLPDHRASLIKKTAHNLPDFTPKPSNYVIYIIASEPNWQRPMRKTQKND
ncbi:hypothetical protein [Photobacterium sp. 1_MG-2023]|uniref:hypothetical protein n=1 Tax=Photobacterium sp. 1_MG-2023 TaxID=3062646 RepID=UPI0026E3A42C|nr:hypothetical protein [Photobacterium sp. 1_MG-2023]MDO6707464.1 hypothetical protein [Photobacterium sp. 1_MG-2023]